MRCKNCGKTLSKTDKKVCSYCGTKVPNTSRIDVATIVLAAITLVLFVIFIGVVYDKFLADKFKKKTSNPSTTPSYSDTKTDTGNSSGNLLNGGHIAETEDYIYYTVISKKLEATLYRRSKDKDEEPVKVAEGKCSNINVMSKAIYFTDDNNKLYRISLSGNDKDLVKNIGQTGVYRYVTVVGDWIYYSDSGYKLHKMRPLGETITKLSEYEFKNITVSGNRVFGINNEGYIVYIQTDGTKERKSEIKATEIVSTSDWLYINDGEAIYRAIPGSLAKEKIADVKATNINVYGNLIFYYDVESGKICQMDKEGENKQEILEFNAKAIYIVEKTMFILKGDDNLIYEYDREKGGEPKVVSIPT